MRYLKSFNESKMRKFGFMAKPEEGARHCGRHGRREGEGAQGGHAGLPHELRALGADAAVHGRCQARSAVLKMKAA